jgi:AcrR family transcriptional regulator
MTRIANATATRGYSSELRAQQADATRTRILDATVRVMARGLASVSMPEVAREAGVSVPTIYRHFGSKEDLLAAIYPHVARRVGLDKVPDPVTFDDLRDGIRTVFEKVDSYSDLERAAVASPGADVTRRLTMPQRLKRLSQFADSVQPRLARADRERITRLLVVLTASSSLRMWRDHLGVSVEQAADDIDWVMRASIAASRRNHR